MKCHCACALRFLRQFLVLFWGVWWAAGLVTNFLGTGRFWGLVQGVVDKNYVNFHHALSAMLGHTPMLSHLVLALILLAQLWVVVCFFRAIFDLMAKRSTATSDVSAYAFGLALTLLMLLCHAEWMMMGSGVDIAGVSYMLSAMFMTMLSFLTLIFTILESKCCQC